MASHQDVEANPALVAQAPWPTEELWRSRLNDRADDEPASCGATAAGPGSPGAGAGGPEIIGYALSSGTRSPAPGLEHAFPRVRCWASAEWAPGYPPESVAAE